MFTDQAENFTLNQPLSRNDSIFIDSAIASYQELTAYGSSPAEMVALDSTQNDIAQIRAKLARWSSNIAAEDEGQVFIQALSNIARANYAAFDDLIGSPTPSLEGDWDSEASTETGEDSFAFQPEMDSFDGLLGEAHDMHGHSKALLSLVPHSSATHVAVRNGSWFKASTWKDGVIPSHEADVLIPEKVSVVYNGESDARLDTLRIDGKLKFVHRRDTKMLIDTLVVAPTGKLLIGTAKKPIKANKTAKILFTSDSEIDTEWDPTQLSRGLISHGKVSIYGADKLDFGALAQDVQAGDHELVLKQIPTGWRVGDQLVLTGTDFNVNGSHEDNTRFQDEELTITAINNNRIRFINNHTGKAELRFDHERPDEFEDQLDIYVANTTRNVSFETENGEQVPIENRGHVMFMHNPDVEVYNTGFYHLGRTDKSKLIDEPGENVDGDRGQGTNQRGRYSLHFHRAGSMDINGTPAMAEGNAIVESPGWGITHHDSHAILKNNVVFNVAGSAIVTEAGNELGAWINNITIKTKDADPTNSISKDDRLDRFDHGHDGEGYWMQGAGQVVMADNIATSAEGAGVTIYSSGDLTGIAIETREVQTFPVAYLDPELQSIAKDASDETEIDVAAIPLKKLSGFESYNSSKGIFFWAALFNSDGELFFDRQGKQYAHDFYSVVEDFSLWQVDRGVSSLYSGQVELNQGLILGNGVAGITGNGGALDFRYKNLHIEGFKYGLRIPNADSDLSASRLENSYFANNEYNLELSGDSHYFEIEDTTFISNPDNVAPEAHFTFKGVGGLGVAFDGTASFDPDMSSASSKHSDNGIVSYGWDFDGDGKHDQFGSQPSYYFSEAGTHEVTLTVWDDQGMTKTLSKTITVNASEYQNLFLEGGFSIDTLNRGFPDDFGSLSADEGWLINNDWMIDPELGEGGAAVLTGQGGIGQVIKDDGMRRGNQTLSLDLKHLEGSGSLNESNEIVISLWGVDGEFWSGGERDWNLDGPQQAGNLAMSRTKLLEKRLGDSSFDWTSFEWNVDFGDGYQFILFQVETVNTVPNRDGDFVALDNVQLVQSDQKN